MDQFQTHYQNLQVTENASLEVIKGAYRYLAQKWHPDKNPNDREKAERITRLINEAYAVLSDPERRKDHDKWIQLRRQSQNSDSRSAPEDNQPTRNSKGKATHVVVVSGMTTWEAWKTLPAGQDHPDRPVFSGTCHSCGRQASFRYKDFAFGLLGALGSIATGFAKYGWKKSIEAINRSQVLEQHGEFVNCSECAEGHVVCMKCLLLQRADGLDNRCSGCGGYLCD